MLDLLRLPPEIARHVLHQLPPYDLYHFASLSYACFCLVRDTVGLSRQDALSVMIEAAERDSVALLDFLLNLDLHCYRCRRYCSEVGWCCFAGTLYKRAIQFGNIAVLQLLDRREVLEMNSSLFRSCHCMHLRCFLHFKLDRELLDVLEKRLSLAVLYDQLELVLHLLDMGLCLELLDWKMAAQGAHFISIKDRAFQVNRKEQLDWLFNNANHWLTLCSSALKGPAQPEQARRATLHYLLSHLRQLAGSDMPFYLLELLRECFRPCSSFSFYWLQEYCKEEGFEVNPRTVVASVVFYDSLEPGLLFLARSDLTFCKHLFDWTKQDTELMASFSLAYTVPEYGSYPSLPVLRFLAEKVYDSASLPPFLQCHDLLYLLCEAGQLEYLQWIHAHCPLDFAKLRSLTLAGIVADSTSPVVAALCRGHLPVLTWLEQVFQRPLLLWEEDQETIRLRSGDKAIFQWLYNRDWTSEPAWYWAAAALYDSSLELFQWVADTFPAFCPSFEQLKDVITSSDTLAVAKYLCLRYLPRRADLLQHRAALIQKAMVKNKLDLLQWLHRHYSLTAAVFRHSYRTSCYCGALKATVQKKNLFLLRWLLLTFPDLQKQRRILLGSVKRDRDRGYLEKYLLQLGKRKRDM